jgi:hypothetical protein
MQGIDSFSMAWWNTGLAPSAKTRASDEQKAEAWVLIELMIREALIDFIVLCEVSEVEVAFFKEQNRLLGYEIISGVQSIGRSSFDTCLLYNPEKIMISEVSKLVLGKNGHDFRIAQRVDLQVKSSNALFHVFISHWPSRLFCHENSPERNNLGMQLRVHIDNLIKECVGFPPHVILMGDYNDEPFDTTLSGHLMATRDRQLVVKRESLLFNPFWNTLGGAFAKDKTPCGSYFHKQGAETKWRTFDQIIFSHAFVVGKEWRVKELHDCIFSVPAYYDLVVDARSIFDHFPVIAITEKVNQ